jgi:hypothetical protein
MFAESTELSVDSAPPPDGCSSAEDNSSTVPFSCTREKVGDRLIAAPLVADGRQPRAVTP